MGDLISKDPSIFNYLKETIKSLVNDQNPAIRLSSLYALRASYEIDNEWSARQMLNLYREDYRYAGFRWTKEIMFLLYPNYQEEVISIIRSCYSSEDEDAIRFAAYCISEMYILKNEFKDIFDDTDEMSETQANFILEMFVLYFNKTEFNSIAKEILLKYKDSKYNLEAPFAALFYQDYINLERDKDFLLEIMNSNISRRTIHGFVNYLEKHSSSIIDHKDIIFSLSHQVITNKNSEDKVWGIDYEISKLIIRLYDATVSRIDLKQVANECLDLWDLMFENQVDSIRSLSYEIMDR